MVQRRMLKRMRFAVVLVTAVIAIYVGGYAFTFWLSGRGSISPFVANKIEGTVYAPLAWWRLSAVPGCQVINAYREYWFNAGLRSRSSRD